MGIDESRECEIIPELPDDVSLRCLAMISHGFHGVLQTVCKKWRDVFRSQEYGAIKSTLGSSGDWIFVLSDSSRTTPLPNWIAYDPASDSWHPLHPLPTPSRFSLLCHRDFACISVSGRFIVIGGSYSGLSPPSSLASIISNAVYQFDPCRNKWATSNSMLSPRANFACAVVAGKVMVAGGRNFSFPMGLSSAEVYDPLANKWEELPAMPVSLSNCAGLSLNGMFYVLRDQGEHPLESNSILAFDPSINSWRIEEHSRPFTLAMQFGILAMPDQRLYAIGDWGSSAIKTRAHADEDWLDVGSIPPVVVPRHPRPLESFSFSFVALRGNFYVLGGKALRCVENKTCHFEVLKLNLARTCDLNVKPLQWKEVKPMCCNAAGIILGCASLAQGQI